MAIQHSGHQQLFQSNKVFPQNIGYWALPVNVAVCTACSEAFVEDQSRITNDGILQKDDMLQGEH